MNSSALGFFLVFLVHISLFCTSYLTLLQYQMLQVENLSKCSKDTLAELLIIQKMKEIKEEKQKVEDLKYWVDGYCIEIICTEEAVVGEISGDYFKSFYMEVEFEEEELEESDNLEGTD